VTTHFPAVFSDKEVEEWSEDERSDARATSRYASRQCSPLVEVETNHDYRWQIRQTETNACHRYILYISLQVCTQSYAWQDTGLLVQQFYQYISHNDHTGRSLS